MFNENIVNITAAPAAIAIGQEFCRGKSLMIVWLVLKGRLD